MDTIGNIFSTLWDVWKEMFKALMEVLPRLISFILWVIVAIIVLPCVFIAGNIYPAWVDWGKEI